MDIIYNLKLAASNLHLRFARSLAEGKWSRLVGPFIIGIFLILITAVALGCVYGGIRLYENIHYGTNPYTPCNIFDAAYYLLFTNGGQNLYNGSNWLGLVITSLGIIFIAILTSMITTHFERIGQNYLSGESTFLMKEHIVIIGTCDVLYSILRSKENDPKNRFLIMTGRDVIQTRREVLSFIGNNINRSHIVFMYGDRTSQKDINRLSLASAKEVFIIGDSEESDSVESYRDSNNMDCVELIAANPQVEKKRKEKKLPCHVMFEYQTTFVAFQFSEMGDSFKETIDFIPFNFYDMWAQKVLVSGEKEEKRKAERYRFLDTLPQGYINKNSEESVHLIIIGVTKMGLALGIQAAQVCHFPNFINNPSKRTRITFIDAEADTEFNYLNGRYNNLFRIARHRVINLSVDETELEKPWHNSDSWLDVEWEFIKGRVENPSIQNYIKTSCEDNSHIVTVAVCLTHSHKSMATAMFLPESVLRNCLQILVYQRLSGTIVDSVAIHEGKSESYRYNKIRPFGMIDCGYDPQFEEETLNRAKYISYVYDSYYRKDQQGKEIKQWDEKLEKYEEAFHSWGSYTNYEDYWAKNKQVWEKISCQLNALSIRTKLRSIGIDITKEDEPTLKDLCDCVDKEIVNMQIVEHNRWNMEKLLTGYRALTKEETQELKNLWNAEHKELWTKKRKELKEWPHRAHLDICDFGTLKTCEEETILTHDIKLNKAIPYILIKEKKQKNY